MDVLVEEIFRKARPDDLIPICSRRPGKLPSQKGKPYVHSFFPLRVEVRYEAGEIIDMTAALGHEAAFWMLVTLRPEACERDPAWEGRGQRFSYKQEHVSQIHGLFFDLDVGRSPEDSKCEHDQMTADEALSRLLDLVEANVLPMPTLTATSGRGRYFLYLFDEPLDAIPANIKRWSTVVDLVLSRIAHRASDTATCLAPDIPACHTLNRCFKAPGTLGGKVAYSMFNDGSGELRRYDIDEIDAFLLNHPQESDEASEPAIERQPYQPLVTTLPKRRKPGKRSWLQNARSMIVRRNEMRRLNEHRAGRWPRMRHNLMLYFATAERRIAYEYFDNQSSATEVVKEIALRRTLRFNAKLVEPLPIEEVRAIFDTMPRKPQRNETIAATLRITEDEMLACGLTSLMPAQARKRREGEKTEKKNAKDRAAFWLDHFITTGMPIICISKVMGRDRTTVHRYIQKVEAQGITLPLRASLSGRGPRRKSCITDLCSDPPFSDSQVINAIPPFGSPTQVRSATFDADLSGQTSAGSRKRPFFVRGTDFLSSVLPVSTGPSRNAS